METKPNYLKFLTAGLIGFSAGAIVSWFLRRNSKRSLKFGEESNVYESRKSLYEYLSMHYGRDVELLPYSFGPKESLNFPSRCASECQKFIEKSESDLPKRVLDVGCAVGRSSFELSRFFDEVVGLDYSQSFIDACNHMKNERSINYQVIVEGDILENRTAEIDQNIDTSKVVFFQGDACNIPENLGKFGCVLAANLLCRLPNPRKFLERLSSLIVEGGFIVMPSPYSWSTEFTEKKNWIGGYYDSSGKAVRSVDDLKAILNKDFELVHEDNIPFFIRETNRKNQWTVSHLTVWRRVST